MILLSRLIKCIYALIFLFSFCFLAFGQSDVLGFPSKVIPSGGSINIPIFFQDISNSGIDSGDLNIGSFSFELTLPPGVVKNIEVL